MEKKYTKYLKMQRAYYDSSGKRWSPENHNPVVGNYESHNVWPHWQDLLFGGVDTKNLIALEYGCGPGRNLIKFDGAFSRIDGTDISGEVLEKAKVNLRHEKLYNDQIKLIQGSGDNIPVDDNQYDLVFSVICLQHIACYDIRLNIFKEINRVLKPGGLFTFQMGFGKRNLKTSVDYFANNIHTQKTNGKMDVRIEKERYLRDDLSKSNFTSYQSRFVDPNRDTHEKWIFVRATKPL